MNITVTYILFALFSLGNALSYPRCKTIPSDPTWPSNEEWNSFNKSINGVLLKTVPVASSCWSGNPFGSSLPCEVVKNNWTSGFFHSSQPESIDFPLYANNSCLPPGASGYNGSRGCNLGGLPEYIVNATSEQQIAISLKFAADHNIRVVVKGTGHDLNGRSSGAYALSIWTHNFRKLERNKAWSLPLTNRAEDVYIVGSGQQWGNVLDEATKARRVVTTGQDPSVGLGGYIQGGGHGPLSSTYGLAAHNVLQVRIVTTTGQILVANDFLNQDIFWAVRGGGGGQYGVITEYVIKNHPAPETVTMGVLKILPTETNENISWNAAASLLSAIPDLMDRGLTGAATAATGQGALSLFPDLKNSTKGIAFNQIFWAYNTTPAAMTALVNPVLSRIRSESSNLTLSVDWTAELYENYTSFFSVISGSNAAGGSALSSSRLLGRSELVDTPRNDVVSYLREALSSQDEKEGTFATIGLQGGPGMKNISKERWGSVNEVWRRTYLHFITNGASLDTSANPKQALAHAARWMAENREVMWQRWSPNGGAYMNEANPFNPHFKHDFYGLYYDDLLALKRRYDPRDSLFVLSGVGSDNWEYDLDSGKLCRVNY